MTRLCSVEELAETGSRGFAVGEGEWPLRGFVVALPDGRVTAWVNRCPHASHELELRPHRFLTPDRAWIQCSSHGARFDPVSGICILGPCVGRSLQPITVRRDGSDILLEP